MNIPEGFKLVPVEPTAEMINAGQDQEFTVDVYAAMLASAPTPPQPIYDDSSIRGWEVGSKLFRQRLDAHKYITSGQSHADGNGSKLEPLYRAKSVEVGHE